MMSTYGRKGYGGYGPVSKFFGREVRCKARKVGRGDLPLCRKVRWVFNPNGEVAPLCTRTHVKID